MIKQGEIYLVNFAKKYQSEFGKIRPAVVMQNNFLNRALDENIYQSVLVIPLTTDLKGGDFRLKIEARDKLKEPCECVANWVCTLDIKRFDMSVGTLSILKEDELVSLKEKLCNIMES